MTTIISLIGAPCSGKSVLAAEIYKTLSMQGLSCQLVREYATEYNARFGGINPYQHVAILGKQTNRMLAFIGKVDFLVTDSCLSLNAFYSRLIDGDSLTKNTVKLIYKKLEQDGHKLKFYHLEPLPLVSAAGRIHDENIKIDACLSFFIHFLSNVNKIKAMPLEDRCKLIVEEVTYGI